MMITNSVRNQALRCPRCGNTYFPGGTAGLVVTCPVVGCNSIIQPDKLPTMLPDPDENSFIAGAVSAQGNGAPSPLLYGRDEQGDIIVSGVEGSPATLTIPAMVNGRAVMGIGPRAFADQTRLRRVTLPDTVAVIGEEAFCGCAELESVTFGKGLKLLDKACFRGCCALDSVTLPDKLQEIGREAFSGCDALEQVALTGAVDVIRDSAFALCMRLSRFSYPVRPGRVADSAFAGCYALPQRVQDDFFPNL